MLLKLDRAFYVDWLSENKKTAIQDALHYVIGVHPDSMGTTHPDIKIKVESLEARLRFLKSIAACNEEEANRFSNVMTDETVLSPKGFTFLMYQCISDFPKALSEAYAHIMGSQLELEENSPIRLAYEEYAKLDLWTLREACCLVSHMHPESDALNIIVGQNNELVQRCLFLPHTYTFLFPDVELYKINLHLTVTAINAEKLKCIEQDFQGVKRHSVIPIEFLAWAKTKDIKFHPVLEELVLNYLSGTISSSSLLKKQKKPTPAQEDKIHTQVCGKNLWSKNPTMTIASMCKHQDIERIAKNYTLATKRSWLSKIAPPTVKGKNGRPKKRSS